jgi:hypothetical protein
MQFSLSGLLLGVVLISAVLGGVVAVMRGQQEAVRQARFQALERLVEEIHGSVVGYANGAPAPVAIDITGTDADCRWIEMWVNLAGTTAPSLIIVDTKLAGRSCFGELRQRLQNVRFIVDHGVMEKTSGEEKGGEIRHVGMSE